MIFGRVRGRIWAAMRETTSKKRRSAPAGASGGTATSGSSNVSVSGLPVLSTAEEVVRALENGPDEGLVVLDAKAFREGVRTFLRQGRAGEEGAPAEESPRFSPKHLNVLFGDLTRTQQTFLLLLLREPGALVTREELLCSIRGGSGQELVRSHSLNQIAHVLRRRLGRAGRCIETVRGVGFRWNRNREPRSLSSDLLKVAGLAVMSALAIAAGVNLYAPHGRERGGGGGSSSAGGDALAPARVPSGASLPDEPFRAMRGFSDPDSFAKAFASVPSAKEHSPWRMVDGNAGTWFESEGPARAGDWIAFRLSTPIRVGTEDGPASRIEILCGRPGADGAPLAPPCRVECSADPIGAPDAWHPAGEVDPMTGRFVLDAALLPIDSIEVVRIVVAADSDLPLVVREAGLAQTSAEPVR